MSNNNTVSPETAMRLKAAGFPQPEYATLGQFWLDIWDTENPEILVVNDEDFFNPVDTKSVFMPTIPDLLVALGEITIRRIKTADGYFYTVAKNVGDGDTEITSDYSLAEALALMWEKLNTDAKS